jgi:site-specific recombinase XerD
MHRGHGSRLVQGLMEAAGVLGASSHSLRRSHAHRLRDQGADLMVIKVQLGHSSISVTEKYMAVYPREQRETVARLQLGHKAA